MKNAVTLKHLFKVVGRKGQALGSEEACIYFDGRHAVGANGEATVSIDCPLQISKPTLIPVSELKTALIANPELHFEPESDGGLRINGIRVNACIWLKTFYPPQPWRRSASRASSCRGPWHECWPIWAVCRKCS